MAELLLTLGAPIPDFSGFRNRTNSMTNREKLVLSFRAFTSTASTLLCAYHFFRAASLIDERPELINTYPKLIKVSLLKESMLDYVLLQIRRLYDLDLRSLSGGLIVSLLNETGNIKELRELSVYYSENGNPIDKETFYLRTKFLKERITLFLKTKNKISVQSPLISIQCYLARRFVNKRTAHQTLDDFGITGSDIKDLVFQTLLFAKVMQDILKSGVYCSSYRDVENGAILAASETLEFPEYDGPLVTDLAENVELFCNEVS